MFVAKCPLLGQPRISNIIEKRDDLGHGLENLDFLTSFMGI